MPAAVLGCCMRRCERHRLMWQIAKGRSESKGVYIYGIYVHNVYIYIYIIYIYVYVYIHMCV